MKPITTTLLAAALSAAFATASAADVKTDTAAYRNLTAKAAADYKVANAKCKDLTGHAHKVCHEEAKVARARTEHEAVAQYNDTKSLRIKSRTALANSEFALANLTCERLAATEKDNCVNNARSVHVAAVADAKADRAVRVVDAAGADAAQAVRSLSGLMAVAPELLLTQAPLRDAVDTIVAGWDEPTFITFLPDMRHAFASLTPLDTARLARQLAIPEATLPSNPALTYEAMLAGAALNAELAACLARDGLAHWGAP